MKCIHRKVKEWQSLFFVITFFRRNEWLHSRHSRHRRIYLDPLLPPDKVHNVLHEVLLPGAGGPAVVVSAPNEVDDGGEARAADDAQVHGQVEVVSPQQDPQNVTQHIDTPGK